MGEGGATTAPPRGVMRSALSYCSNNPYTVAATAVAAIGIAYPVIRFRKRWQAEAARRLEQLNAYAPSPLAAVPLTRMVRVRPREKVEGDGALGGSRLDGSLYRMASALDLREGYAAECAEKSSRGMGRVAAREEEKEEAVPGMCSLSEYLSSLRPAPSLAASLRTHLTTGDRVRDEIDALLARALLSVLGPRFGPAALPILGRFPDLGKNLEAAIAVASQHHQRHFHGISNAEGDDEGMDEEAKHTEEASLSTAILAALSSAVDAGTGISLLVLGACSDTAATVDASMRKRKHKVGRKEAQDALSIMRSGEPEEVIPFPPNLLHSPFVMENRWEICIAYMVQRERLASEERGDTYDPDSKPVDVPKPLNHPLLPDLYLGFGGARCTHTHREIIRSRLLSVLLNKLGANDATEPSEGSGNREKFLVKMTVNGERRVIDRPCQFVRALLDSGHTVEACPRLNIVSFGMGLCIKEDDDDESEAVMATSNASEGGGGSTDKAENDTVPQRWTNIPIGVVLRSGYEDSRGRPAHAMLTHGGLDLNVSGPALGGLCAVQHYHAINGFCGWNSNHNMDVPWLMDKMDLGEPLVDGEEAIRAVRLAGLVAVTLNTVATKLEYPFGGYGLTGVCLDSTGVLEQALRGKTGVYPMLSVGRFYSHATREARNICARLKDTKETPAIVLEDMDAVVDGMLKLPNDIAASPSGAVYAARRMLQCMPESKPFRVMEESSDVMKSIINEAES